MIDQLEHHLPRTWVRSIATHVNGIAKSLGGYLKAEARASQFISLCKAYESRTDILRTINANLRRGQ